MTAKRQSWTFLSFLFFSILHKSWVHMYILCAQHSKCMCGQNFHASASVGTFLCLSTKHRDMPTGCRGTREHCKERLARKKLCDAKPALYHTATSGELLLCSAGSCPFDQWA